MSLWGVLRRTPQPVPPGRAVRGPPARFARVNRASLAARCFAAWCCAAPPRPPARFGGVNPPSLAVSCLLDGPCLFGPDGQAGGACRLAVVFADGTSARRAAGFGCSAAGREGTRPGSEGRGVTVGCFAKIRPRKRRSNCSAPGAFSARSRRRLRNVTSLSRYGGSPKRSTSPGPRSTTRRSPEASTYTSETSLPSSARSASRVPALRALSRRDSSSTPSRPRTIGRSKAPVRGP